MDVNGQFAAWNLVNNAVPQGSVLGLVLLNNIHKLSAKEGISEVAKFEDDKIIQNGKIQSGLQWATEFKI